MVKKLIVVYKLIFIMLLLILLLIVQPSNFNTIIIKYLRLLMIIFIITESIILFKEFLKSVNTERFTNAGLSLLSVFVTLLALEAAFMFIPKSDNVGYNLASNNWFDKYWNPINSFGFRDIEPDFSKPAILFIGDSFTAGHGLKRIDDRFSDIVRNELLRKGCHYSVINLGVNGSDTSSQYEIMVNFIESNNLHPKKIVLQYYGNDIDMVALERGLTFDSPDPYYDVPVLLSHIIRNSYLLDYIYWSLPRNHPSYREFIQIAYNDQEVVSKHQEQLKNYIDFSSENNMELSVVIFPFMLDLDFSNRLYVDDLVDFFEEFNVNIINVSALVNDMPVSKRTVNNNDSHASPAVNQMIANELLESMFR